MHQQAQLRLHKAEVEKLGAEALVVQSVDLFRTQVFKERNLLLRNHQGPFQWNESLVFATALSDPSGRAAATYGVARRCLRWGGWAENQPCWFVIDRKGIITYRSQPTFNSPTSFEGDIENLLKALRKAARD